MLNKYGALANVIKKDGLKLITHSIHIEGENNVTMTKSVSIIINDLTTFKLLKPEMVVTIGDRYETMATGICASFKYFFNTYMGENLLVQLMKR